MGRLNSTLPDNVEPISIDDARTRFPGSIECLERESDDLSDPSDVLFISPDGGLHVGNTLDGLFDSWIDGAWGQSAEAIVSLIEGPED